MELVQEQLEQETIAVKKRLRQQIGDYKKSFQQLSELLAKEVADIKKEGANIIPQYDYADIEKEGGFSAAQRQLIQQRGCVIVRQTLPAKETSKHYEEFVKYVEENGYYDGLESSPLILKIFWSKAQIWARHHKNMAFLRSQLNRLWLWKDDKNVFFNPDQEITYADCVRRRPPSHKTGLAAHIDAGGAERWLGKNYSAVYRKLFSPEWQTHQPFDAAYRSVVETFSNENLCSVFRTFQGWLALSSQGAGEGTLKLVPSSWALPYMLLRALQDDVPETSLCGAFPARSINLEKGYHDLALQGLISIPTLHAGDTVWWHPDIVHSVEDEHNGQDYSSVFYIGAVPDCPKNRAYLKGQQESFLAGKNAPDFPGRNAELNYHSRATKEDLGEIGLKQMGFK